MSTVMVYCNIVSFLQVWSRYMVRHLDKKNVIEFSQQLMSMVVVSSDCKNLCRHVPTKKHCWMIDNLKTLLDSLIKMAVVQ